MVDDRKLYAPVTSQAPPASAPRFRAPLRRWTPLGPDESVLMDTSRPYAGEHSPLVKLNGVEARGIPKSPSFPPFSVTVYAFPAN